MIRHRMPVPHRQWSPRSFPWNTRRVMGALLTLACLPTLILNVGTGRSVLLHEHQDSSLHGHVLAASRHDHHHHDHDHPHNNANTHHDGDEDTERPLAGDGVAAPLERHDDGAVIRGTEVAVAKRQNPAAEVAPSVSYALPSLWAGPEPPVPPPLHAHDPSGGIRRTQLTSIRVTVLLV